MIIAWRFPPAKYFQILIEKCDFFSVISLKHIFDIETGKNLRVEKREQQGTNNGMVIQLVVLLRSLTDRLTTGGRRTERATSKNTVLQWESALLTASPCWGLCCTGDHEEDSSSKNQIPLEHITAPSQHTVTEHSKIHSAAQRS